MVSAKTRLVRGLFFPKTAKEQEKEMIEFCPKCGEELAQKAKVEKAVVTCQECGDAYVDLNP